jgi:anaerobic selenocysteine-containing dehydrogenase
MPDGESILECKITREEFLKVSAFLGGNLVLSPLYEKARALADQAHTTGGGLAAYELAKAENIIHTVCLQCNTGCGIKAKILDGVVAKIDGNPYSPWTMVPQLPYATPPAQSATVDGSLCAKGQAGLQSAYDPYRIVKVLKRAGRRGEGRWITVDFHQAVREIVHGGRLFAHVPGEEDRHVEGLHALYALRDGPTAKQMAVAAAKVAKKQTTLAEFQREFRGDLGTLIDPSHPDLGPRNNQFVFAWGRLKAGRGDLISRFTRDAFGSVNAHGHTTVCQGSLYFTGKAMSEQYAYDEKDRKAKWTGGKKFFWEADDQNAEFVIYVGVSPFEANYLTYRSPRITGGVAAGRLKFAVVDPRFSNIASKAWKWLPGKPGTEGALALAIIRWVIDNGRCDARYLANANKAAAVADKETTWCNATWLVKVDKDSHPGDFLRGSDIGIPKEKRTAKDGTEYDFDRLVVLGDGKPVAFDPNDEKVPAEGDLLVDTEVAGVRVKSALQLLKESASVRTIQEWADLCGVPAADIEDVAREFTSHGKKAAADIHRGASQHTNGYYNCHAWLSLNLLVGNYDWAGGMVAASTYDHTGEKASGPFNMKKLHPAKMEPFGVDIIRANTKYEDTTLFAGYPAKRPWFPLASDIYQEIVPSIGDQYPYPVKALFLYMGTPVYALPAGHTNIAVLSDVVKLPLFVTSDIVIGETSMYADYVFPDLSYLERWEFHGSHPTIAQKVQPVRQPAMAPLVETVKIRGREVPVCLESMLIAIAMELGLPGFGADGFKEGMHFFHPDDFYLRMVANLAYGEKEDGSAAVPDASPEEMEVFLKARRHLPASVFDPRRWKRIVGATLWPKVVYVLNRGGRFQDFAKSYDGAKVANPYKAQINMYCEKTAQTKNSMTGKKHHGVATYVPVADCLGRPLPDESFPLTLITYREAFHTKSRTVSNYWLLDLQEENHFLLHPEDAWRLGLHDGDRVKVVSASNPDGVWDLGLGTKKPMAGRVKVTEGIRPGVTAFSLGMGHWAYGASDVTVDGVTVRGDSRRGKGVHANAALRVDPHLGNVCLSDLVGASAVFYDTRVRFDRAG